MPTYQHLENQGKRMMQSRENGQKSQFRHFFVDFKVKYLQIANFSEEQISFKLKVIFSTNFRPKAKQIVQAVLEKNIEVFDFRPIGSPFREYLKIRLCYFSTFTLT